MRSHATSITDEKEYIPYTFQYRKRYEVTCDNILSIYMP